MLDAGAFNGLRSANTYCDLSATLTFTVYQFLRTGFFLTTTSHELLQPWIYIYPSGNWATRVTFTICKAARRITTAFTTKERTPTTISV